MDRRVDSGVRRAVERIAHRGAKRELPENSVPAFRRAFELGADAIELDVHATADGVVVVHHDAELRVPGRGARPIDALAWQDLEAVELAPGVRVPRLAEVLELVPTRRTVYVEIKGHAIEQCVADAISASAATCAVHSFDHGAIARMREIAPQIPRGILFDRTRFDRTGLDVTEALVATAARDVWPQSKLIDAALVATVHRAGCRVVAWTVNSRAEAARLVELGVDGLCGDDVRVFDGVID